MVLKPHSDAVKKFADNDQSFLVITKIEYEPHRLYGSCQIAHKEIMIVPQHLKYLRYLVKPLRRSFSNFPNRREEPSMLRPNVHSEARPEKVQMFKRANHVRPVDRGHCILQ